MPKTLSIQAFLDRAQQLPIFDVRSPAEFAHGHIPGAINLPLFSDAERAEVGTLYKQQGAHPAMLRGLEFVGPKMREFVESVHAHAVDGQVLVHCWRGGQRSGSMAWLLEFSGLKCGVLEKGYKTFRHYVLDSFQLPKKIIILSGMTGSGKTEILHYLRQNGEQIVDLEGIARHKGSAFGGIEKRQDIQQEQFENELAMAWQQINPEKCVWLEDESQRIGRVQLPDALWQQMKQAPTLALDIPVSLRCERILDEYAHLNREALQAATKRIAKRLGGLATKQASEAIENGALKTACEILLQYYDKYYIHGIERKEDGKLNWLKTESKSAIENAKRVLAWKRECEMG